MVDLKQEEKKDEKPKILLDIPVEKLEDDLLNRKPFVDVVTNLIEENIQTPYSIGIYGDWGSGKTSIMKFIQEQVEKAGHKAFWYSAWQYENEHNLIYPLIHIIEKEIKKAKIKGINMKEVSKSVASIGLGLLCAGSKIVDFRKWNSLEKRHLKRINTWIDEISNINEKYCKLINILLTKKKKDNENAKLIVFIDDLDRCLPDNAVKILESIKNVFNKGNCIFVLGMDKNSIAKGIMQRYHFSLNKTECMEYLDKIINFSLEIPELEISDIDQYFQGLKSALKLAQLESFLQNYASACEISRLHNPRKFKIIFNKLFLIIKTLDSKYYKERRYINKESEIRDNLLCLLTIHEYWYDIFFSILEYPNNVALINEIKLKGGADNSYFDTFDSQGMNKSTQQILKNLKSPFFLLWTNLLYQNITPAKMEELISLSQLIGLKKHPTSTPSTKNEIRIDWIPLTDPPSPRIIEALVYFTRSTTYFTPALKYIDSFLTKAAPTIGRYWKYDPYAEKHYIMLENKRKENSILSLDNEYLTNIGNGSWERTEFEEKAREGINKIS